ncbi:MAG: type II toxin-antitoxin system VapC family toxin [Deltaproteobacteria bacterium]|nr:type II toxin-antitoxin system VapC family toxin [Deltaproteobacteria bacterium]
MKLVLDTNIYSDYAEGLPETVDFLATHGEDLYLPSVVIGELNFGFMKGSQQQFNERKLKQFIKRLRVEIIDVDADVARKYAIVFLSLQKKGTKIPINDVWIAASCMGIGGTLLTRDRHFEVVEQIETVILN